MVTKAFIASIVRALLAAFFGFLVTKKVLPADTANELLDGSVAWLALVLAAIIPLAWSWVEKRFFGKVIDQALKASPTTPMDTVIGRART